MANEDDALEHERASWKPSPGLAVAVSDPVRTPDLPPHRERMTDKDPAALVEELGVGQISDESALEAVVRQALEANPGTVADIKAGKKKAAGAIVGWVMKETKGSANPGTVNRLIRELLD